MLFIFTSLAILLTGCPSIFTRVTPLQEERIKRVEENLADLTRSFLKLLEDYNPHLQRFHDPSPGEESVYSVSCITYDVFDKTKFSLSKAHKLNQLESWGKTLFSCTVWFQEMYSRHLQVAHGVVSALVPEIKYAKPLDPKDFEVRLQILEANLIILADFLPKIEENYRQHMEKYHGE